MITTLVDARKEMLAEELNHALIKKYGTRITLKSLKEQKKNGFLARFNYNKIFHIIDDKRKKVFVRNIYFEDIFTAEIKDSRELDIPVREVNKNVKDHFIDLSQNLFSKIIQNKDVVIKILHNISVASHFLNKFYTILTELAYSDIISRQYLKELYEIDEKNKKYVQLIIDAGLAEFTKDDALKASSKFKKILEEKKDIKKAVEEGVYFILNKHYDYIIFELNIGHIKAYINIVASTYYMKEQLQLKDLPVNISTLHCLHEKFFGNINRIKFSERVNSLVASGVLERYNDTIRLAAAI